MAVLTKAELLQQINTLLADNSSGDISAADIRSVLVDIRDSMALQSDVDGISLRDLYGTGATPVAGDRFFFSDENQPGDPIRYVQYRELAAAIAALASPVLIVSNIASYDAAQNRFEDSGGNEVVIPDGSIVTLTQAIYDAAVADAGFTLNANAIFLTR